LAVRKTYRIAEPSISQLMSRCLIKWHYKYWMTLFLIKMPVQGQSISACVSSSLQDQHLDLHYPPWSNIILP